MSIKATAYLNPFSSEKTEFDFEQGISINEIIKKIDVLHAVNTGWRVLIDDEIVTDFEQVPKEGQHVYLKIIPENDTKDVGTGMKAAGYLSIWAGILVGGLLGWTGFGGMLGGILIGTGVSMLFGGTLLLATDIPNTDTEKPETDPSIRGSRNQSRPYGIIPTLFGRRRIYADLCANPYTWVDPSDGSVYLYQLFCVGQKDLQIETSTFKIDETPLVNFSASGNMGQILSTQNPDSLISLNVAYGASTPPLYTKCVHEIQLNTLLKNQTEEGLDGAIIRTTPDKTTEINVDIFAYNGLGKYDDNGHLVSTSVEVKAEYKLATAPDSAYTLLGYFKNGSNTLSGSELKTKRFAITKTGLTAAAYSVRLTRVTTDSTNSKVIDSIYVGSIRAVKNEQPVRSSVCQRLTLIGLRIKASEKLQNVVEQLNFIAQSKLQTYNQNYNRWESQLSSNPASAAIYAMQGDFAQQKLTNSEIDKESFRKLYTWCSEHSYECNAYVCEEMTISSLLNAIASTCRAEILRMNGKVTVIQDIARDSFVQLFTPRNSANFKETMALPDVPDEIKLQYVDRTSGFAENEVSVYNTPTGASSGEPVTSQSVKLWGITNYTQAQKIGLYNYAVANHRFSVFQFDCDFEYLLCRKGDWIKYAGDIALAGISQGRIVELITANGGVTGFICDEQVPMESGKNYAIRVRKNSGEFVLLNVVNDVNASNTIMLESQVAIPDAPAEGDLFTFGERGNDSIDLIVTDIQCGENLSATLTCVEYRPEIFAVDEPGYILPAYENKLSETSVESDSGAVSPSDWKTFFTYNDSEGVPESIPVGDGTNDDWHLVKTAEAKWMASKTSKSLFDGDWDPYVYIGPPIQQYSINGTTNWHSNWVSGDLYSRTSVDGGITWSEAIRIVGEKGDAGDNAVTYEIDCPMVFKAGETVQFKFYKVESGVRTAQSRYFKWYKYENGAWSSATTGTGSSATTSASAATQVKCEIYASSSSTTPLDVEYSNLVSDGAKGDKGDKGDTGDTGASGTDGTNTWYSSASASSSTTSIALSTITTVAGHSVSVGDLIVANSLVFLVTAVSSSAATVTYKQSIKGSTGSAATNVYLGNENITLMCDKDGKLKSAFSTNVSVGAYTGTSRKASTITKSANTSNVTVGTITNGTTSADGTVPLSLSAGTVVTAGKITLSVVANSITFTKYIYINMQKDGQTGEKGDNGTSPTVSGTDVTYQQADSGSAVPTGNWSATPPTATAGKYMWTRTVVTYDDGATSTSYAVSKNGSNGTNGTSPWTVTCSEPSLTLSCGAEKTVTAEKSITIKFNAFQGTTRKAATIATSTLPSGVSVTSNTAATTSADGSLVLKIAAGANLGGTTTAYNTVIITLTVTANSIAYTFSITLSKQVSGQWQTAGWLDLTASTYDTNTWYPVTGTALPKNPQKIQVSVRGDGQTNIPWSSHSTGKIGVEFCVEDVGIAWGWLPSNQCTIYSDTFAQTKAVTGVSNQSPVSYTQMSNSSTPVIWLRGGAKYYVEATYAVTWTIRTEATTISSQTVTPSANTRPTPRGVYVRGKGISTVTEYYKLSANTTETFDSSTYNSWSTSPSTLTPTTSTPYLLNAERITLTDGVTTTYEYKAPHVCLTYQEDGADGRGISSIENVYKLTTNTTKPTAPGATDSVWTGTATGSTSAWGTVCPTTTTTNKYLWNCERISYDDGTYTVTPVALMSTHGTTGTSYYTYIRYSANSDGTDFVSSPTASTKYIGIYSGTSSSAPTSKTSYTWTKFVGEDGANGSSLVSKGNWAANTAYKVLDVVYVSAQKKSYICKTAHTSGSSFSATNWNVVASDGSSATQYYIHFVYCDDKTSGTNYSTTESRKYVGVYTDTTEADASTFAIANAKEGIVWSKAEGEDGVSPTVSGTDVTYQQADSGTTVPTGTWSATPPTATAGKYMWTKTVVTYDDGATSTSYAVSKNGTNGAQGASVQTYQGYYSSGNIYLYGLNTSNAFASTAQPYFFYGGAKKTPTRNASNYCLGYSDKRCTAFLAFVDNAGSTWASGVAYKIGDLVTYTGNGKYICTAAHTSSSSILPTNTSYWRPANVLEVYVKFGDELVYSTVTNTRIYAGAGNTSVIANNSFYILGKITHTATTTATIQIMNVKRADEFISELKSELAFKGIVGLTANNYYSYLYVVKKDESVFFTSLSTTGIVAEPGDLVFERGVTSSTYTTNTGVSDTVKALKVCNGFSWETITESSTAGNNRLLQQCQNAALLALASVAKVYSASGTDIPAACGQVFDLLIANKGFIDALESNNINFRRTVSSIANNLSEGSDICYMGRRPFGAWTPFQFGIDKYLGKRNGKDIFRPVVSLGGTEQEAIIWGCLSTEKGIFSRPGSQIQKSSNSFGSSYIPFIIAEDHSGDDPDSSYITYRILHQTGNSTYEMATIISAGSIETMELFSSSFNTSIGTIKTAKFINNCNYLVAQKSSTVYLMKLIQQSWQGYTISLPATTYNVKEFCGDESGNLYLGCNIGTASGAIFYSEGFDNFSSAKVSIDRRIECMNRVISQHIEYILIGSVNALYKIVPTQGQAPTLIDIGAPIKSKVGSNKEVHFTGILSGPERVYIYGYTTRSGSITHFIVECRDLSNISFDSGTITAYAYTNLGISGLISAASAMGESAVFGTENGEVFFLPNNYNGRKVTVVTPSIDSRFSWQQFIYNVYENSLLMVGRNEDNDVYKLFTSYGVELKQTIINQYAEDEHGYIVLDNGLKIQWGAVYKGSNLAASSYWKSGFTLPLAYTSADKYLCFLTVSTADGSSSNFAYGIEASVNQAASNYVYFSCYNRNSSTVAYSPILNWIAIGY